MKRGWVLAGLFVMAAVLVCVVLYAAGCVSPSGGTGGAKLLGNSGRQAIMTVNGRKVYADELLKSMVTRNALRQFASICTLKEQAAKKGIKIDPAKLKARIEEQKAQMVSMGQDWQTALSEQGITEKDVEDQIGMGMLFEALVNSMVEVTDEQIKATWEKNKDQIITQYLTENKLPDTEKPKVTFEQCKQIATDMCKSENGNGKQADALDTLTQETMLTLDAIQDPTERKLYEDLVINNVKKQAEKKKQEAAKNAAAAGAAGKIPPAAGQAPPAQGGPSPAQGGARGGKEMPKIKVKPGTPAPAPGK
jgi:hypothetical protein